MNHTILLSASFLFLGACAASTSDAQSGAAETAVSTTVPAGPNLLANGDMEVGTTGWAISGSAHAGYGVTSSTERHGGQTSALVAPVAGPVPGYVTIMQSPDATPVRGKHVRASLWARLEGTFSRTDFWIRARNTPGGDGPMLGANATRLEANGPWKHYEIDLDIPANATFIDFGAGVVGDGKLFVDDAVLTEAAPLPAAPFALANGDLETGTTGWSLSGGGQFTYNFSATTESHAGQGGALLRAKIPGAPGYATAMQIIDARSVRGKHVRLTVWARTEGATGRVDVWTRARKDGQGGDGPMLGGKAAKPAADSPWTAYTLELDVPQAARYLDFGVGIAGPGTLWFDDASLAVE